MSDLDRGLKFSERIAVEMAFAVYAADRPDENTPGGFLNWLAVHGVDWSELGDLADDIGAAFYLDEEESGRAGTGGNMLIWLERRGVDTGPLRDLARQNRHLLGRG